MSLVASGEGGANCKAERLEGDEVGGIKDAFRGVGLEWLDVSLSGATLSPSDKVYNIQGALLH